MERDLNVIVVEPKRLFSYQLLNGNTIVLIFYSNGALLGQRNVGLRYIAYWPDNLPTCLGLKKKKGKDISLPIWVSP